MLLISAARTTGTAASAAGPRPPSHHPLLFLHFLLRLLHTAVPFKVQLVAAEAARQLLLLCRRCACCCCCCCRSCCACCGLVGVVCHMRLHQQQHQEPLDQHARSVYDRLPVAGFEPARSSRIRARSPHVHKFNVNTRMNVDVEYTVRANRKRGRMRMRSPAACSSAWLIMKQRWLPFNSVIVVSARVPELELRAAEHVHVPSHPPSCHLMMKLLQTLWDLSESGSRTACNWRSALFAIAALARAPLAAFNLRPLLPSE